MPEVYEIKDPRDGSVFELQLDHPPTPEEARTAVAKYRVTSAKASGQPTMGADSDAGPLSGIRQMYRRAFPPQAPRLDSNIATIGSVGIAPEEALMAGQAGRAVVGAAKAGGGVIGAAKEVIGQATPVVKYEATKHMLTSAGIPEGVAIPIAMAVSGYQRSAKPGAAPESPASVPAPSAASAETVPPPSPTPSRARPARAAGSTPPAAVSETPAAQPSSSDLINQATRREAAKPENVAKIQALRDQAAAMKDAAVAKSGTTPLEPPPIAAGVPPPDIGESVAHYQRRARVGFSQAEKAVRAVKEKAAAAQPRTTTQVSPAMEEIDQRMSGGVDMPTKGNGAPAFDLHSMSPAEKSQALKWYEAGVKPEDIVQRITASRKFSGTMHTATPDEAAAESARMARESAKRSRRGAPEE